jgi:hypothetical protein
LFKCGFRSLPVDLEPQQQQAAAAAARDSQQSYVNKGKVVGAEKQDFAWIALDALLKCVQTPRGTYFYNSR